LSFARPVAAREAQRDHAGDEDSARAIALRLDLADEEARR